MLLLRVSFSLKLLNQIAHNHSAADSPLSESRRNHSHDPGMAGQHHTQRVPPDSRGKLRHDT